MSEFWSNKFDSSPRHCWDNKYGVRSLDTKSPEYSTAFDANNICLVDHTDNPRVVGKVEWLRFIHAFDGDFGEVKIVPIGEKTIGGTPAYCEVYKDFKVFLNHDEGWAVIECYNPELFDKCTAAFYAVMNQYEDMK